MGWNFTDDVEQYLGAAGEFLRSRPAEHNAALTVSATVAAGNVPGHANPPLFGWLSRGSQVGGAIVHTRPSPLGLFGLAADDAAELVAALQDTGREPDCVVGPVGVVQAFAEATGRGSEVVEQQLLYRLRELVAPRPTAGQARLAQESDRAEQRHLPAVGLRGRRRADPNAARRNLLGQCRPISGEPPRPAVDIRSHPTVRSHVIPGDYD